MTDPQNRPQEAEEGGARLGVDSAMEHMRKLVNRLRRRLAEQDKHLASLKAQRDEAYVLMVATAKARDGFADRLLDAKLEIRRLDLILASK